MNITCVVFGILFSAAGALFAAGKLHTHLPAWKRMPPEEKEKIRILPLCRNIGEVILLSGIIFLLNGFWSAFRGHWFTAAMIAWLVVAGVDVYLIGKSRRYKNE